MYKVYYNGKFVNKTQTEKEAKQTMFFLLEASSPGNRVVIRNKRDRIRGIYSN